VKDVTNRAWLNLGEKVRTEQLCRRPAAAAWPYKGVLVRLSANPLRKSLRLIPKTDQAPAADYSSVLRALAIPSFIGSQSSAAETERNRSM